MTTIEKSFASQFCRVIALTKCNKKFLCLSKLQMKISVAHLALIFQAKNIVRIL